jgi:hypothetical protein
MFPSDSPIFHREKAANEQGEAAGQVKADAEAQGKLLALDHPASASVRRIGQRLAAKAVDEAGGGRYSHMKVCANVKVSIIYQLRCVV